MRYRIVHMTLDPFLEHSVPIGALVEDERGVRYVSRALCGICLTVPQRAVAELVGSDLTADPNIERVPDSCGPQIYYGVLRTVPSGVPNVERWVRFVVFGELDKE